ncbi:MAG: FAD-binding and (Fe-S)-binding domain-containing protein [Acidimicrobiales bacterium]|jgi:FAD/FMN-containing dehydrogenase/Fe-S oxidoreductase
MTLIPGDNVDRSGVDETVRRSLERDLVGVLRGEVHFDGATRGIYATDSSNYRQVPLGVVFPVDEDDVRQTVLVCRRHDAPILARGAGTSLAGQACNVAVVIDMSRHMNKIIAIDAQERCATVQPGVVLDDLNAAVRLLDLTFGPDPATHAWCTLGGMVGNNSCGTHGLYTGKTVDNVHELVVITAAGERMVVGQCDDDSYRDQTSTDTDGARILRELRRLRGDFEEQIRTGFPQIPRRVSGFNLDQLLPENGFDLARALVGSESTCALVTEITVSLSPWPKHRTLVVLGYDDIYIAADNVPSLLVHDLIGLEGFDGRLVDQMRRARLNVENLHYLPDGQGWLMAEVGADSAAEVESKVQTLVASLSPGIQSVILRDHRDQEEVWRIRESGLGATARPPGQPVNYEGWEDAAVAPEQLGRYLRGIRDLWQEFGYNGAWYGHFGQGCVHTRNNFDLSSVEGLRSYRSYVERAADLCVSLGGSISGEHGDGQARGELLERMYGPELMEAFRRFKAAWDPRGKMNPGKVIDAYPLDTNIRYGPKYRKSLLVATAFPFEQDGGSLQNALERCVGVGKCRSETSGVMCPSYRVTHDEKHSTRGRAKLFVELFQGETTVESWRNKDVFEALDLCLSCKGCATDCPTHVDMATYKAEFLHHYYAKRLRPRSAYAMGLLPWTGRVATRMPRVANAVLRNRFSAPLFKWIGGISQQRRVPPFALKSFRRGPLARELRDEAKPTVVLWPDTFTDLFVPERGRATVEVLRRAGERVALPKKWACCGRPLYDSGMLKLASAAGRDVLDVLDEFLAMDIPIVVPEPSCLATFRDELPQLLPSDPRAAKLASLSRSLAEHLEAISWTAPVAGSGATVSVHPHCHQRAVQGSASEVRVLTDSGFDVQTLDLGCCGLAGSFGFEKDHDELSRQIARDQFVPGIVRGSLLGQVILDGFSCQLQAGELTDVATTSTAELLALLLKS